MNEIGVSRKKSGRKAPSIARLSATLGAVGAITIAPLGVTWAQDIAEEGGVLFDLTASQSIRASDNPDLEDPASGEVRGITSIDGSIASITRSRSFTLGFQAALEVGEDGFQLGDTGVDLSYVMIGRGSEFEVFADYTRRNVTTEEFIDADGIGDLDLSVTTGTRTAYGYGTRLLVGADGPLTFSARVAQREVEFDSDDPDATDSSTFSASATISAAVDAATSVRLTGSYVETIEDDVDNTRETTTLVGLGVTREFANATVVSLDVDWEEVRTVAADTDVVSGIGGRLAFDRTLPNGAFGVSAQREITSDGSIDEIRATRRIDFPASSLSFDAGIAITNGDNVSPLLGISYERLAPDGAFTVSITQSAAVIDEGTVLNTVGTASYTRNVNAVSSYGAEVSVSNQSGIDFDDTTRRIEAALIYNRELTQNVTLSTGYEHARLFETGDNERSSNTVFVTLSRSFSARP